MRMSADDKAMREESSGSIDRVDAPLLQSRCSLRGECTLSHPHSSLAASNHSLPDPRRHRNGGDRPCLHRPPRHFPPSWILAQILLLACERRTAKQLVEQQVYLEQLELPPTPVGFLVLVMLDFRRVEAVRLCLVAVL